MKRVFIWCFSVISLIPTDWVSVTGVGFVHWANCVGGIEYLENECSQLKLILASNLYKVIGCTGVSQRLGLNLIGVG